MGAASLRFLIDADHGQFYVQDFELYGAWIAEHAIDPDLPPAGWTHEAVYVHRVGVEPHSIAVGTARDDLVESLITVHASTPIIEASAEHIVEADLDVPSGELAVYSPRVDPVVGRVSPCQLDYYVPGSPTSRRRRPPPKSTAAPVTTSSIKSTFGRRASPASC